MWITADPAWTRDAKPNQQPATAIGGNQPPQRLPRNRRRTDETKRLMGPEVVETSSRVKKVDAPQYDAGMDRQAVKRALIASLIAKLDAELSNMRRAAKDAREAATHEEAKPENDKDTRALEASYLAGAQAARVRELEGSIKLANGMELIAFDETRPIQASAVVTLEDDDEARTTFFVAPIGGGIQLAQSGVEAQVVTPTSPLGKALLGKTQGDVIEMRAQTLRGPGPLREMTIVEVW